MGRADFSDLTPEEEEALEHDSSPDLIVFGDRIPQEVQDDDA